MPEGKGHVIFWIIVAVLILIGVSRSNKGHDPDQLWEDQQKEFEAMMP